MRSTTKFDYNTQNPKTRSDIALPEIYTLHVFAQDSFTIEYATTADKVRLALGRYKNSNAQPVVLMHGLAQNYRVWDFPVEGHNFAQYLFSKGYDVWLPCLRGHGGGLVQSEYTDRPWNVDDFAIYDVPAIIDKILQETGIRPLWVGHSLGGMIIYMHLQGIYYERLELQGEYIHNNGNPCKVYIPSVMADKDLAHTRNSKIKGIVTVASPVAMKWNEGKNWYEYKQKFWQGNKIFPWLSKQKLLRLIANKIDYLPSGQILRFLQSDFFENGIASIFQKISKWTIFQIANSYLTSLFWYPPNMTPQLITDLLYTTLNDVRTTVLEQFADWVEYRTFRSYPQARTDSYIYSSNYDKITVPLLIITGNRDRISSHDIVYNDGYLQMGSKDKTYQCFDLFGHDDLCMGIRAGQEVHTFIEKWLKRFA